MLRRLEAITTFAQRRRRHLGLAALSGALYFTGFCGLEQWYLSWICLVPILWALDDPSLSKREVVAIAWFFGLVTHMGGYTWIVEMLRKFGYLPLPLAFLGYFLLCLGQGSLLAVWGFLTHLRFKKRLDLFAAPVLMAVCEWLWPALFPSYLSNSQYRQTVTIQSLDRLGPLGLTFILTLCSSAVYLALAVRFRGRTAPVWRSLGLTALVIAANTIYGVASISDVDDQVAHAPKRVQIGVVQTSMGIYEKTENPKEGLRRHLEQSREVEAQGAQLIVWPESGYYYAIFAGTKNLKDRVMGPVHTPLLFGGLRVENPGADRQERRLYNSAFLLDGDGNILGTYDKTFLLAFGEYLPLGELLPFLYDLSPQTSQFTRGSHTDPLVIDGVRYGILICYEDILPGFTREVMAHEPDVLINMTNDSWFGATREPVIHLALATFRAVEHRRYLVRSTNTGISAFVDPVGRIIAETPVFARANLVESVAPMSGRTLYGRLGDWVGALCLAVAIFWWRRELLRAGLGRKRSA